MGAKPAECKFKWSRFVSINNPDESLLTLHAAVSEVHLVFTVTDKHGNYVTDLKLEDLEILDDRRPPEGKFLGWTSRSVLIPLRLLTPSR